MCGLHVRRGLGPARSAAVAVAFATMAVPLCMLCGLVIDYGWVLQTKSQLDLAADAAALAGARTAASGYAAGQTSAVYLAEGITAANQWWASQAGSVVEAKTFAAAPTITQTGQTLTASVAYTATVYEVMPQIFGKANGYTASIANSVSAAITVHAYATIDFLLDNTSSMLLPATAADLTLLQTAEQKWLKTAANVTRVSAGGSGLTGWNGGTGAYTVANLPLPAVGNYCAFACHWASGSSAANQIDYYGVGRSANETMRFDLVQSATQTAIQQMESLEQVSGQLSLGIFAFGGVSITTGYLNTVFAEAPIDTTTNGVTTKNAGANAAITAMQTLAPPVTLDVANTNIGVALTDTLAITGQAGTGSTSASPKKSLILVSDGLEDDTEPQSIPSTEGPIKPSVCSNMKLAGYTVYVLYTPLNPAAVYLPNNTALQPFITGATTPSILSALQSCATAASDVIQATSSSDIQAGMVALINQAVGSTTQVTN